MKTLFATMPCDASSQWPANGFRFGVHSRVRKTHCAAPARFDASSASGRTAVRRRLIGLLPGFVGSALFFTCNSQLGAGDESLQAQYKALSYSFGRMHRLRRRGLLCWAAQVSRNAGSHLERARKRLKVENCEAALLPYHTYLSFVPEDEEARAEYALTLMKVAERSDATMEDRGRVMGILPETIRRIPDNDEVREQFIEFTMSPNARQYADATAPGAPHQETPGEQRLQSEDVEVPGSFRYVRRRKSALAYGYDLIGYDLATASFNKDKATAADQPLAYSLMANLVRQHRDDKEQARRIIEEMVAVNPDSYESHLMRHLLPYIHG